MWQFGSLFSCRYVSVQIVSNAKSQPEECTMTEWTPLALCEVEVFGIQMLGQDLHESSSKLQCLSQCRNGCFGCFIEALNHPNGHVVCHCLLYDSENSTAEDLLDYTMSTGSFNYTMGYFKVDLFQ